MVQQPTFDGGSLQDLVDAAEDSVKAELSGGRGLRDFLAGIDKLEDADLTLIVEQAIKLMEGFYVHLPLKRAMHAVDPLQRLRLLQRRLSQMTSEIAFHHEMTDIFTSLRDLHTRYILPMHFSQMVAFLPFQMETCFENGERKYIVTQIVPGFSHPTFVPGVRVTYWNGIPIERAVEIAASYHAGSNPAARHARGVEGLTKRAMNIAPPPDEEWVVVGYEDEKNQPAEFRADWTITGLPPDPHAEAPQAAAEAAAAFGLDLESDTFRRINKMLFAQQVIRARRRIDTVRAAARVATPGLEMAAEEAASGAVQGTESTMPDVFFARVVPVGGRSFAYLRIRTFAVYNDVPFVNEFLRLIELPDMPKDGLIIDVRGNGGGLIWAGERLLQLLTPKTIEPCRLQFINTPQNLQLCQAVPMLQQWAPSLARALETGATFSASFPITPPDRCNDIGQRYYGPVVLITDARCYSTTDMFAAGFKDHKIGTILGTDDNTGAGGANVWTLSQINEFFANGGLPAPLRLLPKGTGMRVAIRRTLRVGNEAGTEIEDLGVQPDEHHELTRADVLGSSPDLLAKAAEILNRNKVVKFDVTVTRVGPQLKFQLAMTGVDYVDVFVAGRPRGSRNVVNGALAFDLPENAEFTLPNAPVDLVLRGYAGDTLVCARRFSV
jgi:C-terminal processing protease CtpA/Prc